MAESELSAEVESLIAKAQDRLGRLMRKTLREQHAFRGRVGLICHCQDSVPRAMEPQVIATEAF
jgi:hypothetical protein